MSATYNEEESVSQTQAHVSGPVNTALINVLIVSARYDHLLFLLQKNAKKRHLPFVRLSNPLKNQIITAHLQVNRVQMNRSTKKRRI